MLPIKLKLENFFSHRNCSVDFSKFESALLLGNTEGDYTKSNGSGKSAVFEGILWCLFNKSRASMMDDIVLWGETHCSATFDFSKSGYSYRVKRSRNKINSTSLVEFYKLNEKDEWQNISGSTSGDTSKKIQDTIKLDSKTFTNSIYFRQNDISEFAESEPSKRKEILKSIIDISKWDEYEKSAKKEIRSISSECKILEAKSEGLAEDEEALSCLGEDLLLISMSLDEKSSKADQLRETIENNNVEYLAMKKTLDTDSYDSIVDNIEKLKSNGRNGSEKLSLALDQISKIELDLVGAKKTLNRKSNEIISIVISDKNQNYLDDINKDILKCKTDISLSKEMINKINLNDLNNDNCDFCGQDISRGLHDKILHDNSVKINKYNDAIEISEGELVLLESDKKDCKENILKIRRLGQLNSELSPAKKEVEILRSRKNTLDNDKESLGLVLSNTRAELSVLKDSLNMLKDDNFKALRERSASMKQRYSDLRNIINQEHQEVGALKQKISITQDILEQKRKSREDLLERKKRIQLFERLSKFFGKNGIQTILLDAVIEDLEKSANNILSSICNEPSAIMLDTQRVGSDGISIIETLDLRVRRDSVIQNFKSLSGGEQFRISLALRIALSEMSSLHGGSSLEMLLLDEINSPLDKHGTETLFLSVIKSLEKKYKILIITHDDSLKEKFDNILNVTKVNGESIVEFTTR